MNTIETLTKQCLSIREQLGITKEEMFWLRIDYGMKFLRTYFNEGEAEAISKEKGFWDLYVFEWMKDDMILARDFAEDLGYIESYMILKDGMKDDNLLRQIKTLL